MRRKPKLLGKKNQQVKRPEHNLFQNLAKQQAFWDFLQPNVFTFQTNEENQQLVHRVKFHSLKE